MDFHRIQLVLPFLHYFAMDTCLEAALAEASLLQDQWPELTV